MAKSNGSNGSQRRRLRSQLWFDNPDDPGMTAVYLERYLNFGLTLAELTSGRPIIGIAQSGSDLSPCNRHHLELAQRVRAGIRDAGGVPLEFPTHPIQETGKRPTAALDRNLAYLSLVEVLFGYPLDGVVLMTGCDKTTPACLMAAATVNTPAIVLSGGPMLDGYYKGKLAGSGTAVWQAREDVAAGKITYKEFIEFVASSAPSIGHCNTMGTASTMNAMAEALGMSLPGCAAIPAPYRERGQMAYATGVRAVEIVNEDLKPSDILTRAAFENAIVACSAIGGSTNAPIHLNAIAKHIGVPLSIGDWEKIGFDVPLLVNMQPAGEYLGEEYYRAGGLPAVMHELLDAGRLHGDALTINGKTVADNIARAKATNPAVIRPYKEPLKAEAGFRVLHGNLFDSAIMKTSVISDEFRKRYLSDPKDPDAFEGPAVVFDGPEDYHRRIEDPALGHRRTHHSVHARRRADRLSGLGRGRQHAAAGSADQTRHHFAPLCRRRPPVRHFGFTVDPQCFARSRSRWRPGAAQDRGSCAYRSKKRHRRHADIGRGTGGASRGAEEKRRLSLPAEPDAVAGNPARDGRSAERWNGA